MSFDHLKDRFMRFAILVVKAAQMLPPGKVYHIIEDQIIRASSSSASNYRAACRSKSSRDFINKLKIVEEELDESIFWAEFTINVNQKLELAFTPIIKEGRELLSIIVASLKTAKKNQLTSLKRTSKSTS